MNEEFCKECAEYNECDKKYCPYSEEEQTELNEKAKKMPRIYEKSVDKQKTDKKPKTVKVSDEKTLLFKQIFENLDEIYEENAEVVKENKLITVKIGEKVFKIDIIEQRPAKK